MHTIGTFCGSTISLDWRENRQVIVFSIPHDLLTTPAWRAICGLADVLSMGRQAVRDERSEVHVEIVHTDDVDRRLLAISDLVADIRYNHPTMVQLHLDLSQETANELLDRSR
jgi:hypothetical protein